MSVEASVAELTMVFARLQGMMLSQEAAIDAAHQLTRVARDLVGPAVGAGVSLLEDDGGKLTTAATDAVVEAADELQYELGEGPCLSAWASGTVQRVEDTALDEHWPEWSAGVGKLGVRSVLSVPMVFRGQPVGVLKVYATTARAFSESDERMLRLIAGAAATLLGAAQGSEAPHRLSAALKTALGQRQAIDMATGVLMGRRGVEAETARRMLLEASRTQGRPVAVIAAGVLAGMDSPW